MMTMMMIFNKIEYIGVLKYGKIILNLPMVEAAADLRNLAVVVVMSVDAPK